MPPALPFHPALHGYNRCPCSPAHMDTILHTHRAPLVPVQEPKASALLCFASLASHALAALPPVLAACAGSQGMLNRVGLLRRDTTQETAKRALSQACLGICPRGKLPCGCQLPRHRPCGGPGSAVNGAAMDAGRKLGEPLCSISDFRILTVCQSLV